MKPTARELLQECRWIIDDAMGERKADGDGNWMHTCCDTKWGDDFHAIDCRYKRARTRIDAALHGAAQGAEPYAWSMEYESGGEPVRWLRWEDASESFADYHNVKAIPLYRSPTAPLAAQGAEPTGNLLRWRGAFKRPDDEPDTWDQFQTDTAPLDPSSKAGGEIAEVKCPTCGAPAVDETIDGGGFADTYQFRYIPPLRAASPTEPVAWIWEHVQVDGSILNRGLSFHKVDPTDNAFWDRDEHKVATRVTLLFARAAPVVEPMPNALPPGIERLCIAVIPFVRIVKTTSGRIPTERLSAADWHELCKAHDEASLSKPTALPKARNV